jgi:hypothetical protein
VTYLHAIPQARVPGQEAIQHGFVADQQEAHFGMALHRP